MATTRATSATQRPHGGVGERKVVVATVAIFLLFAGFFATAQRAGADIGIPSPGAAGAVGVPTAEIPPGSTALPPSAAGNDAPQAPVELPQPPAQDAATAQAATADAAAAQPQQSNSIAATRTDSSGGESATEQNEVSVAGAAANAASTVQAADSGSSSADGVGGEAGPQQATTDQAATAAAAAAQPQQSNVVIIIRINSPGDDMVSQTNVVSLIAVGANQSSTSQNPAPAAAVGTATTDPQGSSPGAAPTPSTGAQPAQSASAGQQPQQGADVVQQPPRPQSLRAISILAFTAGSNAEAPVPEQQATSHSTSISPPRPGGAVGRSGVFGSSTGAAEKANSVSAGAGAPSVRSVPGVADRTGADDSGSAALGTVGHRVASWLGRTGAAAPPELGADNSGGMSLGLLTLTALVVGLLGWAALTWPPLLRR